MRDNGSLCLVTVDGTDFKINEPTPWDRKWLSHKFNHAALWYEVGVCIQTGWIVWINGPFPAGFWPDINIARDGVCRALAPDEMFLADSTYSDGHGWAVTPTGEENHDEWMKGKARDRHEDINSLLKQFRILKDCFRHHRTMHGRVFTAVANIVQAKLQLENPTFQVNYDDNYDN